MKISKVFLVLMLAVSFGACHRSSDSNESVDVPAPDSAKLNTCTEPAIFQSYTGPGLGLVELKTQVTGTYELSEVHFAMNRHFKDHSQSAAMTGQVLRTKESGPGAVKLTLECSQAQLNGVYVGVRSRVPTLVHMPSERITIFDEGSPHDDPSFNFPRVAEFNFEFKGDQSYQDQPEAIVGHPPYTQNLYLRDILNLNAQTAHFYKVPGVDGFDILLTSDAENELLQDEGSTKILLRFQRQQD